MPRARSGDAWQHGTAATARATCAGEPAERRFSWFVAQAFRIYRLLQFLLVLATT